MHRLDPEQAVRQFLLQESIRETHITAALSGGADSVCLLLCLLRLRKEFRLEVSALHVQHQLRGEESLRDEAFCKELCLRWNVPLKMVTVDVTRFRMQHGGSLEEAARECRYQAFAKAEGLVATAHTASDNLETVLFRLVRGTGLKGLCGIPPRRDRYIRPLLHVTRPEIEAYLRKHQTSYVTDSSNLSVEYTRNFLRQKVIPLLREKNPSLDHTAAEMIMVLREEQNYLETMAIAAYTKAKQPDGSLRGLSGLHPAIQRRCIQLFLEENGLRAGFDNITAVQSLLQNGGRMEINHIWICVSRDTLFLQKQSSDYLCTTLTIGKNTIFPERYVEASVILRSDSEKFASIHKKFTDSVLDYDIIETYAVLHSRTSGLKLLPAGRQHHISVKKWLNASVPPTKRQRVHFLSDASGLLWAEGLGVAAHAAVTDQTQRMLVLQVCETDGLSQN